MSLSLRDQLLAAGLMTKKQAQKSEQQQRQDKKKAEPSLAEAHRLLAQKAAAEKAAKDAELNRQRQEKAERKARLAQVKQLIEQNRLPKPPADSDDYYNFLDGKRIRRIAVDATQRAGLISGAIRIARSEGRYDLVPKAIAERIHERFEQAVIPFVVAEEKPADPDDPYKDFVVPDDLRW